MTNQPSPEVAIEGIRRASVDLSPYELDMQIAVTAARRDVAAAHGYRDTADTFNDVLCALVDVRAMRAQGGRELEDLLSPVQVVRPLTREELDATTDENLNDG